MADPYLKSLLGNGEDIIYATRQHWFVLMRNIFVEGVAILAVIVLFTVLYVFLKPTQAWADYLLLGYLLVIPPFISLVFDFFQWNNRKYVVTNWRVIQLSGIINKNVIDSSLEKVNDVKLAQSFFGRIFNFGTVEILTASEIGVNEFKTIGGPVFFKTTIINAKERLEHENYQEPSAQAKAGPAPAAGIPAQLAQMEELHRQGVLTDEEFTRIKETLISKL